MTSFSKPTKEQIKKTIPLLSAPQHARYFFDALENPLWIEPLYDHGFFKQPHFEELRYLVRMAPHAPAEVGAILKNLTIETNATARLFLEATTLLPPAVAVDLVPAVCDAHSRNLLEMALLDAADFCAHIANDGVPDTALRLARCLFRLEDEHQLEHMSRRASDWYFEALAKVIGPLTRTNARPFISFLLHGLKLIADAKSVGSTDIEYDASPWWRPAVEEHSQNSDHHFESRFVGCVRTCLELAIQEELLTVNDVFQYLSKSPRLIYKRLRLHLINVFAHLVPALTQATLMDRSLLDDYRYKHEYAMLCRDRFPSLDPMSQQTWLNWIDTGPDMSGFDEEITEVLGRAATQDDRNKRIRYWQYQHLHWIHMHLTGDRLLLYERMKAEYGEPTLADMNVHHGPVRFGYESPFAPEDFAGKSFHDVVAMISAWRPDAPGQSSLVGPSLEGLAETFNKHLSSTPDRYVSHAQLMKGRVPIFVRTFVDAAKEAVAQPSSDLGPLLDLCQWIVNQPLACEPEPTDKRDGFDLGWQSSRDSVSELISAICHATPPMEYRARLWSLIDQLSLDTGKSYFVDATDGDPRVQDHLLRAINSPAGKAMEAFFAYARWVADARKNAPQEAKSVPAGFDLLPEVRDLLEDRIEHGELGGFALRAIIGMHWSWIYSIDRNWLSAHAATICDLRRIETHSKTAYGWAAWNAFLARTPPHIEYYRMLRSQFAYAVDQASKAPPDRDGHDRPFDQLAEHLIVLYARGQIGLDDDDQIIRHLLTRTTAQVRTHAVEFVGASLWRDSTPELPKEVHDRLTTLWEFYWSHTGRADAQTHPTSSVFGFWFVSRSFEIKWALKHLEEFVAVVPKPEPQEEIVKTLADATTVSLPPIVRILKALIEGDDENWRIYSWREHAKDILSVALSSGHEIREQAIEIINGLGRRGFEDFGELLPAPKRASL